MSEEQTREKIIIHPDADLIDLIPGYLANRQKDLLALQQAINRQDLEEAQSLGHIMNGSGSAYGFKDISDIGARIEAAAIEGQMVVILEEIKRLEDYLTRVEVCYPTVHERQSN